MIKELEQWLCVIPARLASTRLTEKALADLGGKPMVVRVYERTQKLRDLGAEVVVATDSDRILDVCRKEGVPAILTKSSHQSGSDRCHEVAAKSDRSLILNIQGDEPFVDISDLLKLTEMMMRRPFIGMGTIAVEMQDESLFLDPNTVKVVVSNDQRALYFSRAAIPYCKPGSRNLAGQGSTADSFPPFLAHVGVYAFRRDALSDFVKLPKSEV